MGGPKRGGTVPYWSLYATILRVQRPRHVQRVELNAKDVKADAKFPLLAHEPPGKEVHPDVGLTGGDPQFLRAALEPSIRETVHRLTNR